MTRFSFKTVAAGAQHIIVGFRAPFDASRLEPIAHALETVAGG